MRQLLKPKNWRSSFQRILFLVSVVVLVMQVLTLPANATGVYQMPKAPGTWILDQAEILSRTNEGKIGTDLAKLAKQTGNEVRIVTIHRLDYGETIDSFTQKLFDKWFPTPEAQANQTLLVIDDLTNNTAIRTGEQVKAKLSDAIANSVAQETVQVPIREGYKYNQAFLAASDRLVAVLSGRPDPGPPEVKDKVQVEGNFATPEETAESNATVWVIALLLAATIIPMATYYLYVK